MSETKPFSLDRACRALAGRAVQGGEKCMFHVCSPVGWINDPNGFSVFDGKIHLFFQHYPYDTQWGPMHWGHVITDDLVLWQLLPEALAPDQRYESGCFSGSAVSFDNRHALIYTSHLDTTDVYGHPLAIQNQSLALGDGVKYEKSALNPVVTGNALPFGSSRSDFRDPKVWKENGRYRMVVANRAEDQSGQALLYESVNLTTWRFVTILARSAGRLGKMWECPDFFPLDGRQLLLVCPQEMTPPGSGEFHGGSCAACLIGDWDEKTKTFSREYVRSVDFGTDFYAPQTTLLPDGRRVMIAWMQCWDNNVTPASQDWSGIMTFPRELRVEGGCLVQLPVREIERYYASADLSFGIAGQTPVPLAHSRHLDFTLTVRNASAAVFHLDVAANGDYATRITYDAPARRLVIDRTRSGMEQDKYPVQVIPLRETYNTVSLRVLLDTWTMELFLNDGIQAVSALIYTPAHAQDVLLSAPLPVLYAFEGHEIVTGIGEVVHAD